MPAPAIAGAASPQTPVGDALAQGLQVPGAGADAATEAVVGIVGQVRDLKDQVDAIGADFPAVAPITQQIGQLLHQLTIQLVGQAQMATASGAAVPMGGAGVDPLAQ